MQRMEQLKSFLRRQQIKWVLESERDDELEVWDDGTKNLDTLIACGIGVGNFHLEYKGGTALVTVYRPTLAVRPMRASQLQDGMDILPPGYCEAHALQRIARRDPPAECVILSLSDNAEILCEPDDVVLVVL